MKLYLSLSLIGSSLLLLSSSCADKQKQSQPGKPNIILIMADDMGYSDIGFFGSEIATPNIDKLANEGLVMNDFYNAGRCCPSRAALMTGLYQHQVGVGDMLQDDGLPGYTNHLRQNCVTLAEVLKENGYHTMISGKWHLGHEEPYWPMKRGFQRQYASTSTTGHYFGIAEGRTYVIEDRWVDPPGEWVEAGQIRYKLFKNEDGTQWYATDAYTDRAIAYIDELRDSLLNKPFFLYLPYTAPHWPLHAFPEDIAKYKGVYDSGWDSLRVLRHKRMIANGIVDPGQELSPRNENVEAWESLPDSVQSYYASLMEVYAAMIDNMDQNIGRLIEKLEETGDIDNTLILFLSDNGGCHEAPHRGKPGAVPGSPDSFDGYEYAWANVSNTPFQWFKHWVHEGGISTPFIAWYPDLIEDGRREEQVAHIMDIMPTLVEISGAKYPEIFKDSTILPTEGRSLVPLFKNNEEFKGHDVLFWEHEGNRAVRKGEWKLVSRFNYRTNKPYDWELYKLDSDRTETKNLASENPEKVEELTELYTKWADRCNVIPFEKLRQKRNPNHFQ
jgi:arylsulfatase